VLLHRDLGIVILVKTLVGRVLHAARVGVRKGVLIRGPRTGHGHCGCASTRPVLRRLLLLGPVRHLLLIRPPLQGVPFAGTLLAHGRGRRQLGQPLLPPRDLIAHHQPIRTLPLVHLFRQREHLLHVGPQVRFEVPQTLVADCFALGGVGVDRGPLQTDRAQREHPGLLRQQQHLHAQPLEVWQKGAADGGNGVVSGVSVARDKAERHRFARRPLNRARPEDSRGVPLEEHGEEHVGGVGLAATGPIARIERREVKQGHAVHHEAGQRVGRQTVAQTHRQVERRVIVHGLECSTHAHQSISTDGAESSFLSDKLLANPPRNSLTIRLHSIRPGPCLSIRFR